MSGLDTPRRPNPNPDLSYYVIARYQCQLIKDGSPAGEVTHQSNSTSCAAAVTELEKERNRLGGDFCTAVDKGKRTVAGSRKWTHGGRCAAMP
jgi:hypothetical protein